MRYEFNQNDIFHWSLSQVIPLATRVSLSFYNGNIELFLSIRLSTINNGNEEAIELNAGRADQGR